ncbi:MAG: Do family serine endopeptidase, partial [Pseudohongiellaceae bacterium]
MLTISRIRILISLSFLLLMLKIPVTAAQGLPDFTQLVEQNAPAIVNVSTVREQSQEELQDRERIEELLRYFYGDELPGPELRDELDPDARGENPRSENQRRQRASMGSGFIISSDGLIVTNHHVIADATEITVTLNDRREFRAELVGSDENSDLALLKIEAQNLPQATIASDYDLKVGEWVLAIGSPFGLSYSVAAGIVSYIGRNLPASLEGIGGSYVSYIQTDVAINPGHSGGPLFNLNGEVIGINSQIFTNSGGSIGLSFAIPVDVASNVIAQLRDSGTVRRGWMGVVIEDVSPELAEAFDLDTPHGALVNQVMEPSPAAAAGFRSGDVIVSFNGKVIDTSGDLPFHVGMTAPDTEVAVEVIRNGKPVTISMTVGDLDAAQLQLTRRAPEPPQVNKLGVIVSELDPERKQDLGLDSGVVVEQVLG